MTDGALIQMLVILLLSLFHESTSYVLQNKVEEEVTCDASILSKP